MKSREQKSLEHVCLATGAEGGDTGGDGTGEGGVFGMGGGEVSH